MIDPHPLQQLYARREFLSQTRAGIGSLALWSLLNSASQKQTPAAEVGADKWTGVLNPPHWRPRCRRVIHLYMAGGPSHLETLDFKPKLRELDGQPMPESLTKGQPIAQLQGKQLKCFGPPV